jgi:hypothetical protein
MSKSLIKKLSKINIENIKDVEQIYVDDEYGLKSYPKLETLFGIFLENYKKCEKNHIDILKRTKDEICLLKIEELDDENLVRLEMADKLVTQLLSNTKPSKNNLRLM